MGMKQSPDFAQEVMEDMFCDIMPDVEVYINNIGIWAQSWNVIKKLSLKCSND
jgi:hypothetical protein